VRDDEESAAIPLAEERLAVSKRPVERRVRISTVTEDVPTGFVEELRAERVDVQHVAVERELNERPDIRFEDDVMIIPVVEERLVIEKKLFLVEEVYVRRIEGVERVERPVTLKRQRVVVDRHETSGGYSDEED
jgi:stress response protein YsnF